MIAVSYTHLDVYKRQEYRFNEFVSNQAILLEVGNNKNTIEEARACAKNFAEVLAKIILGK